MYPQDVEDLARQVLEKARAAGLKVATAESCTGGLVAGALTEIAGSSDVFERGFVTYSNAAKAGALGVPGPLIETDGAVSASVARAMAERCLNVSFAQVSIAITGVAGPGGGSSGKPVGLVHFATARANGETMHQEMRFGDLGRSQVRMQSVRTALAMLLDALN